MGARGFALLAALISVSACAGWRADFQPAVMAGSGEFTYFGFHIYTAELWTTRLPFNRNQPFALNLTYHKHITRDRFVQSSLDEIARLNPHAIDPAKMARWKADMERAFVDVQPDERITGVFIPDHGARFYHDDLLVADIADLDFAYAFFDIWLNADARDHDLRAKLLGTQP
jgi:hypothetical protein